MTISELVTLCHSRSVEAGWHDKPREKGTMLALVFTEIAEAWLGCTGRLKDDHLPNRWMEEVEFADAVIRICDYAGLHGLRIGEVVSIYSELHKDSYPVSGPAHCWYLVMYSILASAIEGARKGTMSAEMPEFTQEEDCLGYLVYQIQCLADIAGFNLAGAIAEKLEYNLHRADHKRESREQEGGKKF